MEIKFRKFQFVIPYTFLLLVLALFSFWQLAFLQNGLQWDIHDVMLPWRHYAGECLQNGIFPLWDPYQNFGFPIHADLQYTNWNPEVWLIGNLCGYSIYTIYFLVFFYVWMAGIGMFKLAGFFNKDKRIAFFLACSYMLSGCVVAHMQQFVVVIGMAWIPFVCWQFFEFLENLHWKNVFGFSLFFYLLMSSGYQALAFMLVYFFTAVVIYKTINWWKNKDRKKIISFVFKGGVIVVLSVVLLLPVFVAVHQSTPFVTRLDKGVSLAEAQFGPFSPQSLVSLALPVTTIKAPDLIKTDSTCANLFFGFVAFSFFLFSLFEKKTTLQKIILCFIFLYLLASFGDYLPVRKLLYDFVPLMNLFRLPGLFRIVVLLLMLVQLSIYLKEFAEIKMKLKFIFSVSSAFYFILAITFYFLGRKNNPVPGKISEDIFSVVHAATVWELMFVQSLFFFLVSIIGLFFVYRSRELDGVQANDRNIKIVVLTSVISLFAGIQFNIYYSIASENPPSFIQRRMKELPSGFPLLPENAPSDYSTYARAGGGLYRNTGNFFKEPIHDEYSSYRFDAAEKLNDVYPQIKKQLTFYPVAYLADSVYEISGTESYKFRQDQQRKVTFLMKNDSAKIPTDLSVSKNDSICCEKFSPNEMVFNVHLTGKAVFNLLQSYYTGWEVMDNGKPVQLIKNAGLCMSVLLQKGDHDLKFRYKNKSFTNVFWVSLCCFVFSLLFFLWFLENRWRWVLTAAVVFLSGLTFRNFETALARKAHRNPGISGILPECKTDKSSCVIEDHFANRNDKMYEKYGVLFRSDNTEHRKEIFKKIQNAPGNKFCYAWCNQQPDEQILEFIHHYFPKKEKEIRMQNNNGLAFFSNETPIVDFENVYEYGDSNDASHWMDFYTVTARNEKDPGHFIIKINKKDPYSPAFVGDASVLFGHNTKALRFSFRIKSPGYYRQSVWTILSLNEKIKETIIYSAEPYFINENDWNFVSFRIKPGIKIKPGTTVKIFIENSSSKTIEVKDLRVETLTE